MNWTWHKYIFNDISALNDISYKIKCITLHTKNLKTKKILGEVIFINQAWWHELSWGLEYEIDNILGKWSPSRDGTLVLRCINLWILFPVVTCNFFVGWIKSMFMVYYALEYIVRYKLYVATIKFSTFLFDFLLRILYWGAIKFTIDSF